MKVYHQAGHNTKWNLDSLSNEKTGNGIIFSPVHLAKSNMEKVEQGIKNASIFDPQYYIPDSQKAKLNSYEFFPEQIANGFSTSDFESLAHRSAEQCLNFQTENNFEIIIIPARYYPDLVTTFIEKQKAFSVEPFLAEAERLKVKKEIFITLPTTIQMLKDENYRTSLLNWITSYPEISGVYFLNQISESTKQLTLYENLIHHVEFILDIQSEDLKVIIGYCNIESILLSSIDPYALTMGAYENTRKFSIEKFLDNDSDKRGPAPRVYLPSLLNWVRYDTVVEIKEDFPALWEKMYSPTEYMNSILSSGERPHFTKPELYKHHFQLIFKQLNLLSNLGETDRLSRIEEMVTNANRLYDEIERNGVMFFDDNCKGGHLSAWNRVLRKIKK